MFIGRRKELDAIQSLYDKDGFGMMVIYGRRRIGKSTLINEFIKNKNAIFYTATKVGQNRNLELFAKQVISVLDPDFESASFPSTEDIFNFITKKLPDKKIVLVIDELPYWAEKDDSLFLFYKNILIQNGKIKIFLHFMWFCIELYGKKSP